MIEAIYLNFFKRQAVWLIFIINFFPFIYWGYTNIFTAHV